jgi:acyl-CoA thioester hydrolase
VDQEATTTVLSRAIYRLCMVDVDAAQVIYFASPYRWHEGVLSNWLADIGHPISRMLADEHQAMPAIASSARYLRPLRLDDVVTLELVIDRIGTTSLAIGTDVRAADGELAAQVRTTNVWTVFHEDGTLSPTAVPDWFRQLAAQAGRCDANRGH